MKLKVQRKLLASSRKVTQETILSDEGILKLSEVLPTDPQDIISIKGIDWQVNPRFMVVISKFLEDEGIWTNKRAPEVEETVRKPGLRLNNDKSLFSTFR